MSRIAVVGSLVDDTILRPGREPIRDLGGIAYAVGVLARLAPDAVILPACRVSRELFPRVRERWGTLANVDPAGIRIHDGPPTRVRLEYGGGEVGGDREERLLDPAPPLTWEELGGVGEVDWLLLNCITGFDVEREAVARVQAGETVLDVHSLVLGLDGDGRRRLRRPPDLERWVAVADVLQCNRVEAGVLLGEERPGECQASRLREAHPGLVAAIVTRGAEGAIADTAAGRQELAAPSVDVVDPTGAGDVFGAAFVAARAAGADHREAAAVGVEVASASCTLVGSRTLDGLPSRIDPLR